MNKFSQKLCSTRVLEWCFSRDVRDLKNLSSNVQIEAGWKWHILRNYMSDSTHIVSKQMENWISNYICLLHCLLFFKTLSWNHLETVQIFFYISRLFSIISDKDRKHLIKVINRNTVQHRMNWLCLLGKKLRSYHLTKLCKVITYWTSIKIFSHS